ncbi:MAG: CBS domain-containing protein [Acidimicrobiia bacterium]|nr:MAG: CBS domain-containing protein [Acidimicrobiia bacterium]
MKVGDVMSTEVITIDADAPLKEAATAMVHSGVSGLPVVDDDRKVVGIITEADFVTAEANRSWGRQRRRLLANFLGETTPPNAKTVSDVMTADPHTIDSGSSVTEAARAMTDLRVKRLPVIFPDGILCGIISRADVMAIFARPDEALADEIVSSVVVDVLQLLPGEVTVKVKEGVAEISGHVSTRMDGRMLEELASRVEGIVAVDSTVTWTHGEPEPGSVPGI